MKQVQLHVIQGQLQLMENGALAQYPAEEELRQGLILTNAVGKLRRRRVVTHNAAQSMEGGVVGVVGVDGTPVPLPAVAVHRLELAPGLAPILHHRAAVPNVRALPLRQKLRAAIHKPAVILLVQLRAAIPVALPFILIAEPIVEQEHPVVPITRKPMLIAAIHPRLLISFART